ncbi:MAG: hypothetical protein ACXWJB_08230 [Limisphaerales bacterium]
MVRRVLETIEIVDSRQIGGLETEICATADGRFDEAREELVVELDSFTRPADIRLKEQHSQPAWLPKQQLVRESISRDEALELARDVFKRWVNKVRSASPSECVGVTNL